MPTPQEKYLIKDLRIRPPSPPNLGGTGFTPSKVGALGGQKDGVCVSPVIVGWASCPSCTWCNI